MGVMMVWLDGFGSDDDRPRVPKLEQLTLQRPEEELGHLLPRAREYGALVRRFGMVRGLPELSAMVSRQR